MCLSKRLVQRKIDIFCRFFFVSKPGDNPVVWRQNGSLLLSPKLHLERISRVFTDCKDYAHPPSYGNGCGNDCGNDCDNDFGNDFGNDCSNGWGNDCGYDCDNDCKDNALLTVVVVVLAIIVTMVVAMIVAMTVVMVVEMQWLLRDCGYDCGNDCKHNAPLPSCGNGPPPEIDFVIQHSDCSLFRCKNEGMKRRFRVKR